MKVRVIVLMLVGCVVALVGVVLWRDSGDDDVVVGREVGAARGVADGVAAARPLVWSGGVGARRAERDGERLVSAADGRRVIGNELVVVLPDGVSGGQIASHYGAAVVGEMPGVGAYRLRFATAADAAAARQSMAGDHGVTRVESNYVVTPPPAIGLTGSEAGGLFADRGLSPVDKDSPVVIGLIDTGVSASLRGAEGFLSAGAAGVGSDGQPTHGDAVAASMLSGMAAVLGDSEQTAVKILPVDIYQGAASTSSYQVAQGVADAIEQGASVINLSLGSDARSGLLQDVIAVGDELGVVFVGAAGNEPVRTEVYPAAYPEVLAVTSLESDGRFADYANRGEFVDVGAPGLVRFDYADGSYLSAGTSMAAGVVSGMIAALADSEGIGLDEARARVEAQLKVDAAGGEQGR